MSLTERIYSILIVSSGNNFNNALTSLLSEYNCEPINIVSTINAAKRAFAERAYDFVIVNAPLPDDAGVKFSMDICSSKETVVLLMVQASLYPAIHEKVVTDGVYSLPKPTSKSTLATALNWMSCTRERLRKKEQKTLSIEEKMAEIRLVNRAKWLLISEQKMAEEAAHHYIEREAMNRSLTKREIADEIVKQYS